MLFFALNTFTLRIYCRQNKKVKLVMYILHLRAKCRSSGNILV